MTTTDLARPTTTGSEAQEQLARMRARAIARYKLTSVPGRGEELAKPQTNLGVSFGYGCKTIRMRPMVGREWKDPIDFQIQEGWTNEMLAVLDRHFGYVGRSIVLHQPA